VSAATTVSQTSRSAAIRTLSAKELSWLGVSSAPFNSLALRAPTMELRHLLNRSSTVVRQRSAMVTPQKRDLPLSCQLKEPESSMKFRINGILRRNRHPEKMRNRGHRAGRVLRGFWRYSMYAGRLCWRWQAKGPSAKFSGSFPNSCPDGSLAGWPASASDWLRMRERATARAD